MGKDIYKAVANLPEELITPEIAAAAIEEGKIELLDYLPHRYLTGEVVVGIIEKNADSYSWRGFNLSSLPEDIRTKEVCEFAVKKDDSNIEAVPITLRSAKMLEKILNTTKRNIRCLHLFPAEVWTPELALEGVQNIYSETTSNYGPRGGYHGTSTRTDIKRVQILLSYVPRNLMNEQFYLGLFEQTRLSPADIHILTPERHKNKRYYTLMAQCNFDLVPVKFYDYDTILEAISKRKISLVPNYRRENSISDELKSVVFREMDDAMADRAIDVEPEAFKYIPERFQTPQRLITAINKSDRENVIINSETHSHLLTKEVCMAYISKNRDIPTLPQSIWTPDFVEHCMKFGTAFKWFKQMPKELQTAEIVYAALNYCTSNIEHIRIELLSLEQALAIYRRENYYRKFIPAMFIKDFENETGLNSDFMGGELSYAMFREKREMNTYCKVGNSFLSISKDGYNSPVVITMTRRTPQSFRPVVVFTQSIDTYHTTWLEKMIADYDPSFVKPSVSKTLKPYQANGYFSLKKVGTEYGADIYANVLLGEQVYFSAMIDGDVVRYDSLDNVKEELKEFHTESIDIGIPVSAAGLQVAI